MRGGSLALASVLGVAAAHAAVAEGFSVYPIGELSDRRACLQRAERALSLYMRENGGDEVVVSEWVVYGWDFQPGDQDVAFMCYTDLAGMVNAVMVVHGETEDAERIFTADEIERYWTK